ncbi:MAG: hypothetical protein RMJ89_03200 [Flammeovirgaceae bacterium]|nr:hypothetical protein [Flammeovirgaceae bacterium]
MSLKTLVSSALLFLVSYLSQGQYARMEAGAYVGYGRLGHKNWNTTIRRFNLEEPILGQMKKWGGGYSIGAYFRYNFPRYVMLTPSIGIERYGRKFESDSGTLKLTARFLSFRVNADIYLLKLFPNFSRGRPPEWKERFFVRVAPGYAMLAFRANGYTKNPLRDSVAVAGRGGFLFGLGSGYQFYLTDNISISPIATLNLGKALASGFAAKMLPNGKGNDGGMALQLLLEAHVGYTIKAQKPLCPIPDCRVAQEHRHADLGGNTVFRGNPHNLWQNPRYGQKHRGGDRKKLKYKDKKKKEEPKADEKTAASTEEETQADKKSKKLVFDPTKDYKAPKNVPQKSKKQPTSKQQPSEEDQIEEENE